LTDEQKEVAKITVETTEGKVITPDTDADNWGKVSETEDTMTILIPD